MIKELKKTKKKLTHFRPRIRSRHSSHDVLREELPLMPFRSVIRLGSTTDVPESEVKVQLNSVEAIRNSSNKLLMKQCFTKVGVKTADWWTIYKGGDEFNGVLLTCRNNNEEPFNTFKDLTFPIVAKHIYGSRGEGNTLINSQQELEAWLKGKTLSNYIFEKFYSFSREYRLHVTEEGCFYTCRKMLKEETPEDKRWYRNDNNSVWILEENPQFDKPVNWKDIEADCVKALKAVGLDFAAMDVRVQSKLDKDGRERKNPEWILLESNSAPSLGRITTQKYLETLPKLLQRKFNQLK